MSAQFAAEAAYAESIFRNALGDTAASITALQQALTFKPDYAPAILSMGSVEYQRQRQVEGKRLFFSLLSLPRGTEDLCKIIDEAGSFLIGVNEYADGLELFREAARKFPHVAAFQQGISCCAGHEGFIEEALAASRRAMELDPENAAYVSDLGWTLVLAKRYHEAEAAFLRALAMDPSNERAQANLQYCRENSSKRSSTAARKAAKKETKQYERK
jgi:tetratricopeptide (TPR) repeat protein